ncbi:AsnC family transcriptional regulator [Brevirhabdus pacifica]|uniref:AsnC family transcriptional regulator n=1 Tax=Brevirhabdus pacifica TaxID=1267768 RepID=A0A1U7DLR5_9RHOB|nr:AsnC family transcriptional regulator [Brevirhabdus pacifica]OWU76944.1 AsnC family transcriptional regulator [Loktanella sp. 22II-4b]PJJ86317.1 AsnC family transcriptional regulator [Brevirhabdus pacifica]
MLKLDDRDIAILRVLAAEGRISKAELAKRVNLSPTPTWERLRRLEASGVIRGYHADIDLGIVAARVEVFVTAEIERHRAADFAAFEEAMQARDEVAGCWALGGGFDYLLQIVVPDIDRYQRFMDELLQGDLGLARYYTYIVTKPVKQPGGGMALPPGFAPG